MALKVLAHFRIFVRYTIFYSVSRPRNAGELTPVQQSSANGKLESVDKCQDIQAIGGGTLRCFLHTYSEGASRMLSPNSGSQLNNTPFIRFPFFHLLYSSTPTLRAKLSNKISAPTSYLRFSFEEVHINIPGRLNILCFFFSSKTHSFCSISPTHG